MTEASQPRYPPVAPYCTHHICILSMASHPAPTSTLHSYCTPSILHLPYLYPHVYDISDKTSPCPAPTPPPMTHQGHFTCSCPMHCFSCVRCVCLDLPSCARNGRESHKFLQVTIIGELTKKPAFRFARHESRNNGRKANLIDLRKNTL